MGDAQPLSSGDLPVIVATSTLRRRRRKSPNLKPIINLILFAMSLIPMCIVAWRIDILNELLAPRQAVVSNVPKAIRRNGNERPRVTQPLTKPETTEIEEPPARDEIPQQELPQQESPQPVPTLKQTVLIHFSNKRQKIGTANDGPLRVVEFRGCPATIEPADGALPVTITLNNAPRPARIQVSSKNDEIFIEAVIQSDAGNDVELSVNHIEFLMKRAERMRNLAERRKATAIRNRDVTNAQIAQAEGVLRRAYLKPEGRATIMAAIASGRQRVAALDTVIGNLQAAIDARNADYSGGKSVLDWLTSLSGRCEILIDTID
jgi:hypothetical protein